MRKHSPCSTKLRSKKCRINVSSLRRWRFRLECSNYSSRQITGNINFFYIFSSEKVPCDKMSLAPIQKLLPDSITSRTMIEGVFLIFSRNAFFDVSKSAKTQKAKFRAGGVEIARRGPPATSSRRVLSHHWKTLKCKKTEKGSPFFSKCVFDSFRLTTTFRESFCTIKIARFQPDDNVFLRHFAWRFRLECSKYASRQITGNINFSTFFLPKKCPVTRCLWRQFKNCFQIL